MANDIVFCPKCGAQSFEPARFCKRCGTNLEAVSQALTGTLAPAPVAGSAAAEEVEVAYASVFSKALYHVLTSIAVFVAMLVMFRGAFWVYFMLFWVASAIRDLVQAALLRKRISNPKAFQAALDAYSDQRCSKRERKRRQRKEREQQQALPEPPRPVSAVTSSFAPDYVPPVRSTGEVEKPGEYDFDAGSAPPSVTEGTTALLDKEQPPAPLRADHSS